MTSLDQLYQETILDHYKRPRYCHSLSGEGVQCASGFNPLCGDSVDVYLKRIDDGLQIACQAKGCAISIAAASLMADCIQGQSLAYASDLFKTFHQWITDMHAQDVMICHKLKTFQGVRRFPMRIKCVTLSWHALQQALLKIT
jgi:nitrogen fixation protein NifU and related proteins